MRKKRFSVSTATRYSSLSWFPVFLLTVAIVFSTVLGVMKAVRGNMTRTFYARVAGRGEKPKTLKGYFAVAVLYLIAFDRLFGKNRVVKTRNYSP